MKDVYNYLAKDVPEYWSESNRAFDAAEPSVFWRAVRVANPVTSFGSALGDMRDSAEDRDGWGMGLAAASALPTFGATALVKGFLDKVPQAVPSLVGTAKNFAANTAVGGLGDTYHYDSPEEARLMGLLKAPEGSREREMGEFLKDQQLKERAAFIERYRNAVGNRFNPATKQAEQKQEAQPYPMTPVPKRNTP